MEFAFVAFPDRGDPRLLVDHYRRPELGGGAGIKNKQRVRRFRGASIAIPGVETNYNELHPTESPFFVLQPFFVLHK